LCWSLAYQKQHWKQTKRLASQIFQEKETMLDMFKVVVNKLDVDFEEEEYIIIP